MPSKNMPSHGDSEPYAHRIARSRTAGSRAYDTEVWTQLSQIDLYSVYDLSS